MNAASRESVVPSPEQVKRAQQDIRKLSRLSGRAPLRVQVLDETGEREELELSAATVRLLLGILEQTARGHSVAILPTATEVTTQQGAELLNVSRPFLIKLLEEGKIPFRKVGSHRRIRVDDLVRYKHEIDERREKTLAELAEQAQELGMGY